MPQRAREKRPRPDHYRPNANARGYNHAWQKASKGYLDHHPLCLLCQAKGLVTVATVVDHIVPHRGDSKLFWEKNNWQPLCETCHNRKTAAGQ